MKKIIPILLVALTAIMLSSCIIVAREEPTYTITFYNDLVDSARNDIFDWYVKNDSGTNFVVSKRYATHVRSGGGYSSIGGLYEDDYCVIFTFDDTTDAFDGDIYYTSTFFPVDRDLDFNVQETARGYTVGVRSAENQETSEDVEKSYQIVDSEGNIYPLTKVNK